MNGLNRARCEPKNGQTGTARSAVTTPLIRRVKLTPHMNTGMGGTVGFTRARRGVGAAMAGLLLLVLGAWAAPAGAATSAANLYKDALATTKGWSVHYASDAIISKVPILESGDAGPASGTQEVLVGTGAMTDNASLIVIGDLTYLRGNAVALQDLAGLTATQATLDVGHWVQFSSDNPAFSQVVAGVRSHDVAQEIVMKGPFTLGAPKTIEGIRVEAIRGTQTLQGNKKMDAVLYVKASGPHRVVEEDIVNAKGQPTGVEHIVFSKWGESVRPTAPAAAITLGPINAA